MAKQYFNPVDSAAMLTNNPPVKKEVKPNELASLPPSLKKKPVILPPKKANTVPTIEQGGIGFPPPGSPYWKANPLETEHKDGTIRRWGEDTTANSPYTLPKQMLPPPSESTQPSSPDMSDKAKGMSNSYYSGKDSPKGKAVQTTHSNIQ